MILPAHIVFYNFTAAGAVEANGQVIEDPAKAQQLLLDITKSSEAAVGQVMAQPNGPLVPSPVEGYCEQFVQPR